MEVSDLYGCFGAPGGMGRLQPSRDEVHVGLAFAKKAELSHVATIRCRNTARASLFLRLRRQYAPGETHTTARKKYT